LDLSFDRLRMMIMIYLCMYLCMYECMYVCMHLCMDLGTYFCSYVGTHCKLAPYYLATTLLLEFINKQGMSSLT